jgi:hypothetical protein
MPKELQENIEWSSMLFIAGDKFDFNEEADASQSSGHLRGKKGNSPSMVTLATKKELVPPKTPHRKLISFKTIKDERKTPEKVIKLPRRRLIYKDFRLSDGMFSKPEQPATSKAVDAEASRSKIGRRLNQKTRNMMMINCCK